MQIIGHRGAMGEPDSPENTLPSFQRALEARVNAIEFDVWLSRDGIPVVIHDDTVNRTTNGSGYVSNLNLHELKSLRIRDGGEVYQGVQIPTLEEVLSLVGTYHEHDVRSHDDQRIWVNIELKGPFTERAVAKVINDYIRNKKWRLTDFLVSSFDHTQLAAFKKLSPRTRVGALYSGIPIGYNSFLEPLKPYSAHPDNDCINRELVTDAHQRGMKVFVWTPTNFSQMFRLYEFGVDGFFVNDPSNAVRLFYSPIK